MGPSLGRLGDASSAPPAARSLMPQWGRASEGSETNAASLTCPATSTLAAMGPSLGRLGDTRASKLPNPDVVPPQWGRASEGSETSSRSPIKREGRHHAAMGPSLGRLGDSFRLS